MDGLLVSININFALILFAAKSLYKSHQKCNEFDLTEYLDKISLSIPGRGFRHKHFCSGK